MDTIWFEDELEASSESVEVDVKGPQPLPPYAQQQARGVVRVSEPRWKQLGAAPLIGERPAMLWLVCLRFQFDTEDSSRFVFARCQAYLEPMHPGEPLPTVYDFYPQDIYEGKPKTVTLSLSPSLKIGAVLEASAVGISTEIAVGRVQPSVIGFPGDDDRTPYWDLKATEYPIEGTHTFWLVLTQPVGCNGIRLYTRAYGTIHTSWGPVPVRPKQQAWGNRPNIVIR